VIVWDVQSGSQRSSWTINDCVNCIKFSPDSDHVVYGTGFVLGKGEVVIRRLRTGRVVRRLVGHDAPVGAIAISPDGKRIASGDGCELDNQYDATIRIWEVATGREIRRFDAREAQIDAVEFSLDGRSLIAASSEHSISWPTGRIEAWEIASGKQNPLLDKNVCCIGLLRGGRHFVIGDPGALGIVDVESGKEIASIYPQSALRCLAVSPDSRFVVTGGGAWPDDGDKSKGRLHMWKIAK
jgi:WD40 repeat protein